MATPEQIPNDAAPFLVEEEVDAVGFDAERWRPMFQQICKFDPEIFSRVMMNLVRNPNINSSWLCRGDVLYDHEGCETLSIPPELNILPSIPDFEGFRRNRCLVRRLIPRNTLRDRALEQTCLFYESEPESSTASQRTLVLYLPHVSSPEDMPFYHPPVRGIAFLHDWDLVDSKGMISISYWFFDLQGERPTKLTRTALHLLTTLEKHGRGQAEGYVKRVHHDLLVPQKTFQNRYAALKAKYGRQLVETWSETTDPTKHVFEDLGIAAFLMELWDDMYRDSTFPGFVDIGCGNGLLVYLLNSEGYKGWGFDARARKSWAAYNMKVEEQDTIQQLVLLPSETKRSRANDQTAVEFDENLVHSGRFPRGTFVVSNHADELTPWTPILAAVSDCPFIMIPCCSHNLSGARYRAPPPKEKGKSASAYSSLVSWVTEIGTVCGWQMEQEMLRIPSTRNTALIGRHRRTDASEVDIPELISKFGGTEGYFENAVKLVKTAPRGH